MSRRDRQTAQRLTRQRQRQQAHESELAQEPDPQEAARISAWYERETRGYVSIPDRKPHYLCDLGLKNVTRGRAVRLPEPEPE